MDRLPEAIALHAKMLKFSMIGIGTLWLLLMIIGIGLLIIQLVKYRRYKGL